MRLLKVIFFLIGLLSITSLVFAATRRPAPETFAKPEIPVQRETDGPLSSDLAQTDTQGEVVVVVRPVNLSNPAQPLEFEIEMDTHSVELDMDIASLAVLEADNGKRLGTASWNGSSGGHHLAGRLSFVDVAENDFSLDGARTLTLIITDVSAPERVFHWSLP